MTRSSSPGERSWDLSYAGSTVLRRRDDLLTNELSPDELVMLDLDGGTYFGLERVGKAIWDLLEEPLTFTALCEQLVHRFEVDVDTCEQETTAFLEQLDARGLLIKH